jgi:hypothetical protein
MRAEGAPQREEVVRGGGTEQFLLHASLKKRPPVEGGRLQ